MKKIHLKLKAYHKIWLNKTSLFIWICFTKSPELRAMFVRFVKTFCCLYGSVNTGICRKPLSILILILVSFFFSNLSLSWPLLLGLSVLPMGLFVCFFSFKARIYMYKYAYFCVKQSSPFMQSINIKYIHVDALSILIFKVLMTCNM